MKASCLIVLALLLGSNAMAVDLNAIISIESGGNAQAFNYKTKATGLCQITPVVLQDWNEKHPERMYKLADLWRRDVNILIATWYLHERLPEILRAMGVPVHDENIIAAYNWGPANLRDYYKDPHAKLPRETLNYTKKYRALTR